MYYVGEDLKTDLPDAKPPKQIVVPAEKPIKGLASTNPYLLSIGNEKGNVVSNTPGKETDLNDDELEAIVNQDSSKRKEPDDRRLVLKEVRDHLDLLKEFEGVIPEDELNKRKRELFAALPAAPPPAKKLQTATPAKGENEALATIWFGHYEVGGGGISLGMQGISFLLLWYCLLSVYDRIQKIVKEVSHLVHWAWQC